MSHEVQKQETRSLSQTLALQQYLHCGVCPYFPLPKRPLEVETLSPDRDPELILQGPSAKTQASDQSVHEGATVRNRKARVHPRCDHVSLLGAVITICI